ncbi:MAG: HAD family phosphatase [bacterium]
MIKAIIFDMDGLIVDSEPLQCYCYTTTLKKFGVELSDKNFYKYFTTQGLDVHKYVKQEKIDLDTNMVYQEKKKLYKKILKEKARLFPGVSQTIRLLKQKFELGLATSSSKMAVNIVLGSNNLKKYFSTIVTAEQISKDKPDPEIFLTASNDLNIDPKNCLVLEDAQKGIVAAHRAGMKSIAIPNKHTKNNDFSLATRVLSSIKEINYDLINQL